jgi:hypothetical protein
MLDQLTIFDLPPAPDPPPSLPPPAPVAAPSKSARSPHLIDYWEGQAQFYLKLMNRFMELIRLDREKGIEDEARRKVRTHEINRLSPLREQYLDKIRGV